MDQVIIIAVFILPGILINILRERFGIVSDEDKSAYEELALAVIFSLIVLFVSTWLSKYVLHVNVCNINYLTWKMSNIGFLLSYTVLTLVVTILIFGGSIKFEELVMQRIVNLYRDKKKLSIETKFKTEWSEIFENPEYDLSNSYISIERDGNFITGGMLKSYSNPKDRNKGFILTATDSVKAFLDYDKENLFEDRFLNVIDREYFDISTGTLIKFHNKEKIQAYLHKANLS